MRPPIDGPLVITNLFGSTRYDKPYTLEGGFPVLGHTGIDINAPLGTPVRAAWPGTVKRGWDPAGFGNYLVLTDPHGRQALYGHLSGYSVADGAAVGPGQEIARSGSTGNSTGPHVHFEIIEAGPRDYLNGFRGCRDPLGAFDHDSTHLIDLSLV